MGSQAIDNYGQCVGEGAFWHTNMDLYYGYTVGEVVEVEHEPNKYWLATIEYCFKHLILLKWVGNHGEFWIDTSMASNVVANAQSAFNESDCQPKRLFPLGYHLQIQLKSQFRLEKPTRVLEKPSLYDPLKDPYANIKTVDDLLAHDIDQATGTFNINQSTRDNIESASLVLAKCNTKINYKQEDVDEVEAALQNLNEIDNADFDTREFETDSERMKVTKIEIDNNHSHMIDRIETSTDKQASVLNEVSTTLNTSQSGDKNREDEKPESSAPANAQRLPQSSDGLSIHTNNNNGALKIDKSDINHDDRNSGKCEDDEEDDCDEFYPELCKRLQESVISKGFYNGLDSSGKQQTERVFYTKPRQFFDVGGANHERVFVPGTILEVCHTRDSPCGLEICHWFAYVVKNIGGRLTLRWLLSDEPKFRQGRLELKYRHSKWIKEEDDVDESSSNLEAATTKKSSSDPGESNGKQQAILSAKEISFCLHFCDPRISTIDEAKQKNPPKQYHLPNHVAIFIEQSTGRRDIVESIESDMVGRIFCPRRLHLDKDRPLIDNILSTVRNRQPTYLDIEFAKDDHNINREVLISCPEMTKLLKGVIKNELEPGVYEVHSERLTETDEIIKFVYPYDSSYAILPLDWANNNQDCLSVEPSRNPTPTLSDNAMDQENNDGQVKVEENEKNSDNIEDEKRTESIFHCRVDDNMKNMVRQSFFLMHELDVVHPSSDTTICMGRIRKIVYPLIWIQISPDCYTLLPFNSTNIYPPRWCETYGHPIVSLLPPRKLCQYSPPLSNNDNNGRERKRVKLSVEDNNDDDRSKTPSDFGEPILYQMERFDLNALNFRQTDLNYILNEKSNYIKIYFNHKCFTGPSLSKSKICSLPQYVGPGPLRLVMEEVVTKIISVAYVPPRILNDLSSGTFQRLLIDKNLTSIKPMEFKAKYQKRIHREDIPVCVNPDDVALYCESVCEHIKCCYNLFGPNSYDGDDCPGHCRALTKSNKFMKRATYYRDKARAGEFLGNGNNNNSNNQAKNNNNTKNLTKTSNSNTISNSNSNSNSNGNDKDELDTSELVRAVKANTIDDADCQNNTVTDSSNKKNNQVDHAGPQIVIDHIDMDLSINRVDINENIDDNCENQGTNNIILRRSTNSSEWSIEPEFDLSESQDDSRPEDWSIEDVAQRLDWCRLTKFKSIMKSEGIDGQALMLLDKAAIREHFQGRPKSEYTAEDLSKLSRFVEYVKSKADIAGR